MLSVNDILVSVSEEKKYRVLWFDQVTDIIYFQDLTDAGFPVAARFSDILNQVGEGALKKTSAEDDWRYIPEDAITEQARKMRDAAWEVISEIAEVEPDIYERTRRGELVSAMLKKHSVTKATVYKYLKRYWCRGKSKNALLPDYKNCGKNRGNIGQNNSKLGRPRKYGGDVGCNVTEEIIHIFEQAIKRFYHTRQEHSFTAVYNLMLKEYFTDKVEQPDGEVRLQLKPPNELPTIRQFRYWYSKTYDETAKLRARKGDSAFERNHRAVLGKSDTNIIGPGSQYQIDATVGDVYLVSRFNRANIIGRPVIYFVIDTFSRMVAGMYVGLEGPSWAGAMMALCNAASDKVTYCKEYGIEITDEQWPCQNIPDTILADRGEMESRSVETLINTLNIRVDNAPPYRADMKGIVEQYFRTINIKTTVFLPGHVKPDMQQRGGHDYRLDAKLDISQFTRIMIQCVLNHNNEHFLDGYERTEDMIADDVIPVPVNLWNWGISHRSGRLRSVSETTLKLCLMPTGTATVTGKGIRFKGLTYLCDRAIREHWFENARNKGSFRVNVSYDPRNMSSIYIREKGGTEFELCFLPEWEAKYQDKSMDEIHHLQESEKQAKGRYASKQAQARVDLNTEIEKVVREAEEMAKQTALPVSKAERVGSIRDNRAAEKLVNRQTEAFVLAKTETDHSEPSALSEDETLSPTLAMIKKKLEERLDET